MSSTHNPLTVFEDEGLIKPGITDAEYRALWRKWSLLNHPDKGGSHTRFVKFHTMKNDIDNKLDAKALRRYFNGRAILLSRLNAHGVPSSVSKQLQKQYTDIFSTGWRLYRMFFTTLRATLERRKWRKETIKALCDELKDIPDTRTPLKVFNAPQRIGWHSARASHATRKSTRCQKCSSVAVSTGRRCRLTASCRLGCKTKCWVHASDHKRKTSCRD